MGPDLIELLNQLMMREGKRTYFMPISLEVNCEVEGPDRSNTVGRPMRCLGRPSLRIGSASWPRDDQEAS